VQQYTIILTSYNETDLIKKAIERIVIPNIDIWTNLKLIIVATNINTINKAKSVIENLPTKKNITLIQDFGLGKPEALNLAISKSNIPKTSTLVLTDGDVYLSDNSLKELINKVEKTNSEIVSGHPVSIEDRNLMFGFFSHLFCSAADYKRKTTTNTPASGYLYAIKNWKNIFPLPKNLRAEDAYISQKKLLERQTIQYAPKATVNVMFPKNTSDWLKQKTRSLGGNVQLTKFNIQKSRNVLEDIKMTIYPIKFAKDTKEYFFLLYLYPLRAYLWFRIMLLNKLNKFSTGRWESIKSSKHT